MVRRMLTVSLLATGMCGALCSNAIATDVYNTWDVTLTVPDFAGKPAQPDSAYVLFDPDKIEKVDSKSPFISAIGSGIFVLARRRTATA